MSGAIIRLMVTPADGIRVEVLPASALATAEDELVHLLRECVRGGASLGYLEPLTDELAFGYWRSIQPQVESGVRLLLVARDGARIVGSGQLAFEQKPNGRHRAEVCKVMVLPSHRRRGIAAGLMSELERHARERAVTLLYLDTSEGRSGACALYETIGYTYAGGIPHWALDPDGTPAANAIYYKLLRP